MNIKEVINSGKVDFAGMESACFLLGLLSAFDNRFQAVADSAMKEISWKRKDLSLFWQMKRIRESSVFCAKNEDKTASVMKKMFKDASKEQLQVTIQTIIQMGDNLKEIRE